MCEAYNPAIRNVQFCQHIIDMEHGWQKHEKGSNLSTLSKKYILRFGQAFMHLVRLQCPHYVRNFLASFELDDITERLMPVLSYTFSHGTVARHLPACEQRIQQQIDLHASLQLTRGLAASGVDFDWRDELGRTLLHDFVYQRHMENIRLIFSPIYSTTKLRIFSYLSKVTPRFLNYDPTLWVVSGGRLDSFDSEGRSFAHDLERLYSCPVFDIYLAEVQANPDEQKLKDLLEHVRLFAEDLGGMRHTF